MKKLIDGHGTGWIKDYPDFRDLSFTSKDNEIPRIIEKLNVLKNDHTTLPDKENKLERWFSPIEDQLQLGSCTANAAVGLLEYFERRAIKIHQERSRLFLYKVTRNLMGETGDNGATLRATMGAMVLFGVPPSDYWPYTDDEQYFDEEPPAFCYSFAQNFKTIKYVRLDSPGISKPEILDRIKTSIVAGMPAMFGFSTFSSIKQAQYNGGKIPFPEYGEHQDGGHAVVAIGYDDNMKIKNEYSDTETIGALRIRNSWGANWGDDGYGWIPYEYVLTGMADDWWTLIENKWINTGMFGL